MEPELKASLVEQGGKLLSDIIRMSMSRPRSVTRTDEQVIESPKYQTEQAFRPVISEPEREEIKLSPTGTMVEIPIDKGGRALLTEESNVPKARQDLEYRFECLAKHLGGASVLLREAYERANDEGIGDGTAEKIMEAMNEHSGMEADLEKMLGIPDAKPTVDKILSGARAFRAAAWKARLPTGGGTKEDVADARVWNDLMLTEVLTQAKKTPGTQCIIEGM